MEKDRSLWDSRRGELDSARPIDEFKFPEEEKELGSGDPISHDPFSTLLITIVVLGLLVRWL